MDEIHRAALGRVAFLGDLYDARTDQFCGGSLLEGPPPDSLVKSDIIPSVRTAVILSDSLSERLKLLDVEDDLKTSVAAGLVSLGGHGLYLSEERKGGPNVISGALLYRMTTKVDQLDTSADEFKQQLSIDSLSRNPQATHIVAKITWGLNTIVSLTCENEHSLDAEAINDEMKRELDKLVSYAERKTEFGILPKKEDMGRKLNFKLEVFADNLQHNNPTLETANNSMTYANTVQQLMNNINSGKEKQLNYVLIPSTNIESHFDLIFESPINCSRAMHELDEQTADRILTLMDDFNKAKQKLHELRDKVKNHDVCIKESQFQDLESFSSRVISSETHLRSELKENLVDIRYGRKQSEAMGTVCSLLVALCADAEAFISSNSGLQEKISFFEKVVALNGIYIGKGSKMEAERMKIGSRDCYMLMWLSDASNELALKSNKNCFFQMMEQATRNLERSDAEDHIDVSFMVIDLDLRPDLSFLDDPQICICLYREGKYECFDVLAQIEEEKTKCKVRTPAAKPCQRPGKRVTVKLECPGSLNGVCPKDKCSWSCDKCSHFIEYGFDEKFYCACGKAKMESFTFRCGSNKHGVEYISFDKCVIQDLVKQFNPPQEVNILLLGKSGVGKSTFINGIVNYLNFNTLEEAIAGEPLYLIPPFFTETDENYEQHIVQIGSSSNEQHQEIEESATQNPSSYCFMHNNKAFRIIDTPGINDTKGKDHDKINVEKIISYVSVFKELHGICILLQPDETRLDDSFRYCITELLTHLHRDAARNIVFCFTNARKTNYRPGATLSSLKKLFQQLESNTQFPVKIPQCKENMYCVDNEGFKFLCARSANVHLSNTKSSDLDESWKISANQIRQLFEYISKLQPHKSEHTVQLNKVKSVIEKMTVPMIEMVRTINKNINDAKNQKTKIEDLQRKGEDLGKHLTIIQDRLVPEKIEYPRMVCKTCSAKISDKDDAPQIGEPKPVYKKTCHFKCGVRRQNKGNDMTSYESAEISLCKILKSGTCEACNCPANAHIRIKYELVLKPTVVDDESAKKERDDCQTEKDKAQTFIKQLEAETNKLKAEQDTILQTAAQLSSFMKSCSTAWKSDAFENYISSLIEEERKKNNWADSTFLDYLESVKSLYQKHATLLKQTNQNITVEEVEALIGKLFKLSKTGADLENILHIATEAEEKVIMYEDRDSVPKTIWTTFKSATQKHFHRAMNFLHGAK